MAVAGEPWQLECEMIEQRCSYLLTSGLWSDCTFMVGSETNQTAVPAHKLILAMASPVFEAMFYGWLSERNESIVTIPDVQPEAFRALLQYIYTGNADIGSFDMACDLWYGAKKYMLPHLENECNTYLCSVLGPQNVCRAYEFASLFDEKTLMDKCLKIISTNTKEVLNDNGFVDVQLNTVITVCSLDQLDVDSELDLFNAVAIYAEAEQKKQGQFSPPEDGGQPSEELSEKLLSPSVESSSQTSPATEIDSKPPTEVVTSKAKAEEKKTKEDELTIRGALQKIRFLSLSATQFAEGPALSDLLTEAESFAVLMNKASKDCPVPMPTGFSKCREPRTDSKDECIKAGCWEHIIEAIKCMMSPPQVQEALLAAYDMLSEASCIQEALDKGILDALVPALTEGDDECKKDAARVIYNISYAGSPSQVRVLSEAAALKPFCQLLTAGGKTCDAVLCGLHNMLDLLEIVEEKTKVALLLKLREIGVPQLLITVQRDENESNREFANLLLNFFW